MYNCITQIQIGRGGEGREEELHFPFNFHECICPQDAAALGDIC